MQTSEGSSFTKGRAFSISESRMGSAKKLSADQTPLWPPSSPEEERQLIKPRIQRSQSARSAKSSSLSKFLSRSDRAMGGSADDTSHGTSATSLMTDSTASMGNLPHKFAAAAQNIRSKRGSITRSSSAGRSSISSTGDYQTTSNEVEAWMIKPEQHPIATIKEHMVIENMDNIPDEEAKAKYTEKRKKSQRQRQRDIIKEYEETVSKMKTQMSMERKGFAIMAIKAKEEKDKLSAQIQDLSWKVALRGKR